MTEYRSIPLSELFDARSGKAKYIRDYVDAHTGPYPVFSASLARPFGYVNEFDYVGPHLTWVMNGYGGRVQEVDGHFSANRDRGVFVPKGGVQTPDLTYLRFAIEPQLVADAVGRRVDGRLNEYTKIYPGSAEEVLVSLPVRRDGGYDYVKMREIGEKLRRIESAQGSVESVRESLERAMFVMEVDPPVTVLSLSDTETFELSIGTRVLRSQHSTDGIPVFSANALTPFGRVETSNLTDFSAPSLLWGIDGTFDWNLIPAGVEFATTDHCGRLQVLDKRIDPAYLLAFLKTTRGRYGFDRVFRASLKNLRDEVVVSIPLNDAGEPSAVRQKALAEGFEARAQAKAASLAALDDVLSARLSVEL